MRKKITLDLFVRCVMFAVISCCCSSLVHALDSAFIQGVHGKPSFVSSTLFIYSFCNKLLFAIAYVLIGSLIPIKNKVLRGLVYIALIWASNFMPQIMGLACADGEIAKEAFSVSIVISDSIGYLIDGLIIGIILNLPSDMKSKPCSGKNMLKTSLISMITVPTLILVVNTILEKINEEYGGRAAMGVSKEQAIPFYICFYSCFLVTGFLLPVFYRITLYNEGKTGSSLRFGFVYSIAIWTPIVLIMIVFGTAFMPTLVYTLAFIAILLIITYMNGKLMERFEKGIQRA